jgi:vacuolar-type H+-ATPase subunit D/Vma8
MPNPSEHRLDRIEEKLDKLSDAVVSLARMEERLITIFNRIEKVEDRVDDIEVVSSTSKYTLRFIERIFWIVASSGIATIFWYMR